METSVSEMELWFFYYLSDSNNDVVGVLKVNAYVPEDAKYMHWALRQVTEVEHDTMAAFGLPKHTHDGKKYPFFADLHGQAYDIRT